MVINKPEPKYQVFASKAMNGDYLPVEFATNKPVTETEWDKIANINFLFGLESLEYDLQLKDLNSVLNYIGSAVGYLYQQGIPEFSQYQDYTIGSVVQHEGKLYVASQDIQGAKYKEYDPCTPCHTIKDSSENFDDSKFCKLMDCADLENLQAKIQALEETTVALADEIEKLKPLITKAQNDATKGIAQANLAKATADEATALANKAQATADALEPRVKTLETKVPVLESEVIKIKVKDTEQDKRLADLEARTDKDTVLKSATVSGNTLTLVSSDDSKVIADLSAFAKDNDTKVQSGTISGSKLILTSTDGSKVTIDASSLVTKINPDLVIKNAFDDVTLGYGFQSA